MTNHPKRSTATFRFIVFSTITGQSLQRAATATAAREEAMQFHRLADDLFIEIIDCGPNGRKVWNENISLQKARALHRVAFRGGGYAAPQAGVTTLPAVPLSEG